MFFSLSKEVKTNFPNQYTLGELVLNTDNGWHTYSTSSHKVVYKGYTDIGSVILLIDDIIKQQQPVITGNFCCVVYNTETNDITFNTDRYRGFPIYYNNNEVTNLENLDNTVYSDNIISVNQQLELSYPLKSNFDLIGTINTNTLTANEVIDQIDLLLTEKTKNFIRYINRPIKVHLSGGVDSLLVYSYLQKHTDNYELIKCQHFDYDRFWLLNEHLIKQNWSYTQLHHWRESCVLTSGAPGDEFMLRSPTTASMFLKYNNVNIRDVITADCLHYNYFNRLKHQELFDSVQLNKMLTKEKFYHTLCDTILNDWQHHHIGNTLTWTPLRDLRIFKLLLQLPLNDAMGQILNSNISQQLIERNFPNGTKLISDQKNSGAPMKNLVEFYQNFN